MIKVQNYVMVSNQNGTHRSDGGITIGYGHYISVAEWESKEEDYQLLAPYVSENVQVAEFVVNNRELLPCGNLIAEGLIWFPLML